MILMTRSLPVGVALMYWVGTTALAQYEGWQYSGSLWILTTPEGSDLPAAAREEGFPLLVRLSAGVFDFRQAKPHGEDIRFSASGKPIAYQIEEWDAVKGVAAIWVRIPVIQGNARQEIKLYWGKPDAASQSNGAAVFNRSNGYLSVLHLSDPGNPVQDDAGTLQSVDAGTTACLGMIGQGRHFDVGKGIKCGEHIMAYPTGSSSHTSEAWLRAEQSNALVLGWGNEHAQGKVTMEVSSPPHMRMDCYFSGGNVEAKSRIPMSQWIHVAHTYRNGDSRIYVNGQLDAKPTTSGLPLAIRRPERMWIGGWYDNFHFVGDIDEVRISNVARSADWIKLEYENQNPRQSFVGTLVQPGDRFSVSADAITVGEGKSVTVTGQAGGAQKVYWIVKRNGKPTVVAVDQFSYTLDAGRIVGDTTLTLQFKAVYAAEVKTRNIPVTIKEEIPEPVFTLQSPGRWNGRDTIEVVPVITNLAAMKAARAGELHYAWKIVGGAVIKEISPDKLLLKRSQFSGSLMVSAAISNGGADSTAATTIMVTEPANDPWIRRGPEKDEKPEDNQFFARDDKYEGTLYYNGTLDQPAESVFLRLYADGKLIKSVSRKLGSEKTYAFTVKLKPGLIKYKVEFGTKTGGTETIARTVNNLVCGDAYLIDGQSNALATDTGEESPRTTSDWIRSYRGPGDRHGPRVNLWCNPVWKARDGETAELGYWGMELAKRLVKSQQLPIFIINGAVGGTRIDQHQRNPADPEDLSTIYGRTLWRVRQARLSHGIRGILWHQGENDQGAAGPTGGYGWETYQQYFNDMSAEWKEDYPNVQHYYIFQIWPDACSMGGREGSGDMLREMQRTLPRLYSHMDIMSTLGIKPPGPCHYPLTGWAEFARLVQPLIERGNYGNVFSSPITPPNLKQSCFTNARKDAIALEFDQPVIWNDGLETQIYLDGARGNIASGTVAGNVVTLKLKRPCNARKITYLKEVAWSQERLIVGANGIAALTFCNVDIQPGTER
jgi:hypothetical protein